MVFIHCVLNISEVKEKKKTNKAFNQELSILLIEVMVVP